MQTKKRVYLLSVTISLFIVLFRCLLDYNVYKWTLTTFPYTFILIVSAIFVFLGIITTYFMFLKNSILIGLILGLNIGILLWFFSDFINTTCSGHECTGLDAFVFIILPFILAVIGIFIGGIYLIFQVLRKK